MGELRTPTRRKQNPTTLSPSKTKSPEQTSDPNGSSPPNTPSQNTNNPKCHKTLTPKKSHMQVTTITNHQHTQNPIPSKPTFSKTTSQKIKTQNHNIFPHSSSFSKKTKIINFAFNFFSLCL